MKGWGGKMEGSEMGGAREDGGERDGRRMDGGWRGATVLNKQKSLDTLSPCVC